MVNVMSHCDASSGICKVPDGLLIDLDMINRYPKEQIVLITTGSQGEPMSALTRMAFADHRQVEVGPDDMIIISARPIPGNEKTVGTVVDELLKRGCDVVYESMYEVHVSGHACQEELEAHSGADQAEVFHPGARRAEAPAQARGRGRRHGHDRRRTSSSAMSAAWWRFTKTT